MIYNQMSALPGVIPAEWTVICDFDGTIVPLDVTDALLERFALQGWEDIEAQWVRGEIPARECMTRQVALLSAAEQALNAFLDTVPLTEGFGDFVRFCASQGLEMQIVSDGLDYAIQRILARHGLAGAVDIAANHLVRLDGSRYALECPHGAAACPSGLCKCSIARGKGTKILLIGDGRSDCCLAGVADFILARRGQYLQTHCEREGYPHHLYGNFFDIRAAFAAMLRQGAPKPAAAPGFAIARQRVS